jgi:hypothetical protein
VAAVALYFDKTDRLCVSGLRGLDILDPTGSAWLDTIHADDLGNGVSVSQVVEDRIYVMNGRGVVMAPWHSSAWQPYLVTTRGKRRSVAKTGTIRSSVPKSPPLWGHIHALLPASSPVNITRPQRRRFIYWPIGTYHSLSTQELINFGLARKCFVESLNSLPQCSGHGR